MDGGEVSDHNESGISALPNLSQIEASVIDALPLSIKRELELEYARSLISSKNQSSTTRMFNSLNYNNLRLFDSMKRAPLQNHTTPSRKQESNSTKKITTATTITSQTPSQQPQSKISPLGQDRDEVIS